MIVGLDIEGRGPSPKRNGILSIGMCVSTPDGVTRQNARFSMHMLPGQEMDKKCLEEFWQPRMPILEELQKEAIDAKEAMTKFRRVIDSMDHPYIVCDCPAYDVTFINYYLDYFDLPLLQFTAAGGIGFRPIHDADSYARGKLGNGFNNVWVDNAMTSETRGLPLIPKGNHMPDADAEHIVLHHIQTVTL